MSEYALVYYKLSIKNLTLIVNIIITLHMLYTYTDWVHRVFKFFLLISTKVNNYVLMH